jgi:alpha-1,6-mannosyltransferase
MRAGAALPPWARRLAGPFGTHVAPLLLLVAAGVVMQIGWMGVWMLSYRLTHGNDFTFTYLTTHDEVWRKLYDLLVLADKLSPGIEPPQILDAVVNPLAGAFVVTGIGYLAALTLLNRGLAVARGSLVVILAFVIVFEVTLFSMPGLYTTDIFSYVMYGQIAGTYDLNPYIYPPSAFPGNPMVNWIHPIWHNAVSVYGPVWTDISWVLARLTGSWGLLYQVFAYKAFMNVVFLVNLALVWWLVGRFAPDGGGRNARLTAFTLFAWNPMMLFELAGNAHNDGLMVTFLLLSLVPLSYGWNRLRRPQTDVGPGSRAWFSATIFVALSALVKYVTGVVGFFYLVAWLRREPTWGRRLGWLVGVGVASLVVTLVLFWPWLKLPEVLKPILDAAGGVNYTNSLPDLAALTVADQILDPQHLAPFQTHETVRFWMKMITRVLFVAYLIWEVRQVWRQAAVDSRSAVVAALTASTRAFVVLLLLVFTWVLAWYYMWPLALGTMLGWRSVITRVVVALSLTCLPIFYIHHYWSDNMPGALLFFYIVPPLLVPFVELGRRRWAHRRSRRATSPEPVAAGLPSLGRRAAVQSLADLGAPRANP